MQVLFEAGTLYTLDSSQIYLKDLLNIHIILRKLFGKVIMDIYKDFTMMLFLSLTWVATMGIEGIIQEIQFHISVSENVSIDRIMGWKGKYFTILDFIQEINRFFGPVIIINLANLFLTTSIFSFRLLNMIFSGSNGGWVSPFMKIIRNMMTVSGLVFGTETMKEKVNLTRFSNTP